MHDETNFTENGLLYSLAPLRLVKSCKKKAFLCKKCEVMKAGRCERIGLLVAQKKYLIC
jgi:hypothetical protein